MKSTLAADATEPVANGHVQQPSNGTAEPQNQSDDFFEKVEKLVQSNKLLLEKLEEIKVVLTQNLRAAETDSASAAGIESLMIAARNALLRIQKDAIPDMHIDSQRLDEELQIGKWSKSSTKNMFPQLFRLSDLKKVLKDQVKGKVAPATLYAQLIEKDTSKKLSALLSIFGKETTALMEALVASDENYAEALGVLEKAIRDPALTPDDGALASLANDPRLGEVLKSMFDVFRSQVTPLSSEGIDGYIGEMPPDRESTIYLSNGQLDAALAKWNTEPALVKIYAGNKNLSYSGTWNSLPPNEKQNILDACASSGKIDFVIQHRIAALQQLLMDLGSNLELRGTIDGKKIVVKGHVGKEVTMLIEGKAPEIVDPTQESFTKDVLERISTDFTIVERVQP